jgi:hypothetical protein
LEAPVIGSAFGALRGRKWRLNTVRPPAAPWCKQQRASDADLSCHDTSSRAFAASSYDCARASAPTEALGHRHLRALLSMHAALRGQGVAAARQEFTTADIARAVDACRYFGLDALAELVALVPDAASSAFSAVTFDSEYRTRYVTSDIMVDAIRRKVKLCPADFPEPHSDTS